MNTTGQLSGYQGILLIFLFILAISIGAIAVMGADDPFATPADDPSVADGAEEFESIDLPDTVGGGSLGGSTTNPLGEGVNEDNPFQSTEADEQFTVTGDEPQFWRVNAYDQYESGEWTQTREPTRYTEQMAASGPVTDRQSYTITLENTATMVPGPWQSVDVDGIDNGQLGITATDGIDLAEPIEPENEYTVTAAQYDPEGPITPVGEIPQIVAEHYGSETSSVNDQIETVGETVTSDATTSVAAACSVQRWLQANYEYNRTAAPTGEDAIDQFLFDTEHGNAEYFASSMAILLQSQDIPARYVTGYSHGEKRSSGEFSVYQANAHAWTEVYIAGHGWIPFDPTPTESRVNTEREHIDPTGEIINQTFPDVCNQDESSSLPPAGEIDDDEENGDDEPSNGDDPTNGDDDSVTVDPDPGTGTDQYTLTISDESPVPGQNLTVTVFEDGVPTEGITVRFNDEQIGTTGPNGNVTGKVPFSEQLTITLTEATQSTTTTQTSESSDHTYTLQTQGQLSINADALPLVADGVTTVQVTISGYPVEDAIVTSDGDEMGATNETGKLTMSVPADKRQIEIEAERGDFRTIQSISVAELTVTTEDDWVVALPGQTMSATVTLDGQPISEAVVTAGDSQWLTDDSGTASVTAPVTTTTVTAEYSGAQTTQQVRNLLIPMVSGVLILGVTAVVGARVITQQTKVTSRISASAMQWKVRIINILVRAEQNIQTLHKRLINESDNLSQLVHSTLDWVFNRISQLLRGELGIIRRAVQFGLTVAFAPVRVFGGGKKQANQNREGAHSKGEPRQAIQAVWNRFLSIVQPRQDPTMTPTEIADRAVELGLPEKPVNRLVESFRAARYGPPTQQTEELTAEATEAFDQINREEGRTDEQKDNVDSK